MRSAEELAALMAAAGEIQLAQTQFRLRLLARWGIEPGSRVLELGCGQGDMTAGLADAVGPTGHVMAIDIAEPSYGSPVSVGESMAHLKAGPLGARIEYQFNCDVLEASFEAQFDVAVMAHCSWYFQSPEQLLATFSKLRGAAKRLCFSEWDLAPTSFEQAAHLLAVLIQGQIAMHKSDSLSNIRNPLARPEVLGLLDRAGWRVELNETVSSEGMQDGKWEIEEALRFSPPALELSDREQRFLASQIEVLRTMPIGLPLNSYALGASPNPAT